MTARKVLQNAGFLALLTGLAGLNLLFPVKSVAFDMAFYERKWEDLNVPHETGLSLAELSGAVNRLFEYLEGNADSPQVNVRISGKERFLYNEKELMHLQDVKELFRQGLLAMRISGALAALGGLSVAISHISGNRTGDFRTKHVESGSGSPGEHTPPSRTTYGPVLRKLEITLVAAGLIPLVLVVLLAIPAALSFSDWWTRFHLVVFENDLWRLDPERDWLIKMFPEEFFSAAVARIGVIAVTMALACVASGLLVRHFAAHHRH